MINRLLSLFRARPSRHDDPIAWAVAHQRERAVEYRRRAGENPGVAASYIRKAGDIDRLASFIEKNERWPRSGERWEGDDPQRIATPIAPDGTP